MINSNNIATTFKAKKLNPLSVGIFIVFGLEAIKKDKDLHKGAWVAKLLGTLLGSRTIKRSNFHVQYSVQWQLIRRITSKKKMDKFSPFESCVCGSVAERLGH